MFPDGRGGFLTGEGGAGEKNTELLRNGVRFVR